MRYAFPLYACCDQISLLWPPRGANITPNRSGIRTISAQSEHIMKTNLASVFVPSGLAALMSAVAVPASADNYDTIALGRACGPNRYGHPLHLQFSQNEGLCVYPTNNAPYTNSKADLCPTVLSPANMTAMPDQRNNACKQISGTMHLSCVGGGAVYYAAPPPAGNVVGAQGFVVATANGRGQVCLLASGPFGGQSSYPGPCGIENATALYTSLTQAGVGQGLSITPGVAKIPGYSGSTNGLGTFTCVVPSTPKLTDRPDPGIGYFIPAQ